MSVPLCTIRRMTRGDLNTALCWAAREGWNPGLYDATPFRVIDPQGHLMGWIGDRPVASISALRYSASHGFIGLYIVTPPMRGRGLGMQLWTAAMEHLRGCVIGLDGVMAQQDNYQRSGFEAAWFNLRFQGPARHSGQRHARVVPLSTLPFEALAAYDQPFHPAARPAFLRTWIARTRTHALGWWEDGRLRGYGVLRPCSRGHKLGPLCADTPAIAGALVDALCTRIPEGDTVAMDMPQGHAPVLPLARSFGFTEGFATVRMYRGPAPRLHMHRLYALTALEVG